VNRVWVGVDPGRSGAMALVDGDRAEAWPTPMLDAKTYDLAAMSDWFRSWRGRIACVTVEKLSALPPMIARKGGESAFSGGSAANFGRGESRGWFWMLAALRIPHIGVAPQTWQRVMHQGANGETTKARSIAAVQALFPGVSLLESDRSRKHHDGMAEAILIADYGRRTRNLLEA
jgi:hypothetical protein